MRKIITGAFISIALSGCQSVGGPGVSSYFDCAPRGGILKVTYVGKAGASVQVDRDRARLLRKTPSVAGEIYEGAGGYRLQVLGEKARWNGPTREAPYECSRVAVPR